MYIIDADKLLEFVEAGYEWDANNKELKKKG